ncbi:MAG: hypothetical protein ACPF8V_07200 [Luteibaculum sp.]
MKGKYYHLIMERFMLALSLITLSSFIYGWIKTNQPDWLLLIFSVFTAFLYWMRRNFRRRNF